MNEIPDFLHVCRKCGAVQEPEIEQGEEKRLPSFLPSGTSNQYLTVESEPSQTSNVDLEGHKCKVTYWTCAVCGKKHNINVEKIEEGE